MTKLIQFVRADRRLGQVFEVPGNVGRRAREKTDPRAGERDLRRRGEQEHPVGMLSGVGEGEGIGGLGFSFSEMVHGVRIVPEDAKIRRCGRHRGQRRRNLL